MLKFGSSTCPSVVRVNGVYYSLSMDSLDDKTINTIRTCGERFEEFFGFTEVE